MPRTDAMPRDTPQHGNNEPDPTHRNVLRGIGEQIIAATNKQIVM